jgi:hypothetical protein
MRVATERVLGSIRKFESRDASALTRLLEVAGLDAQTAGQIDSDRGHLLVLDVEGALRAVAYVELDVPRSRARVQLLAVDPGLGAATREVEDRMIGVALALCDAYACATVDVLTTATTFRELDRIAS